MKRPAMVMQAIPVMQPAPAVKIALTVPEAAQAIGVSEVFMWRLVGRKIVPSVRIGRSRRILVAALEKYAESLADDSGDAA